MPDARHRDVGGHPDRITHDPHLAARYIGPLDRDLPDREAELAGNQEDLDVEAEAVGPSEMEQDLRRVGTKRLEAALWCIP
jgi:hypothetical protein